MSDTISQIELEFWKFEIGIYWILVCLRFRGSNFGFGFSLFV